ncbi:hypothetical protein A2U01_0059459 [Trifolium medium]|uniref:Uncharacterized protein n=1 Tax=Trifolium medium TaxID=97028 RepID=A0A392RNK8_9FABA|nr:hypothetical protein [Trifolium medium]
MGRWSIALVKKKGMTRDHGKRGGNNASSGGEATVMLADHGIVGDSPQSPRPLGHFSLWISYLLGLVLIHYECYWALNSTPMF